jgi:crotonobetainyl-CoA:carnitine CoA-transferase CaiB-like acyl-CoA transferase
MQALDGITVLDLGRGYPPAHSAMFLGDFGARVIRVDPPVRIGMTRQDEMETQAERFAAFDRRSRNKETIKINLRSDQGQKVFYRLVKKADVLLEGFRPGVMKRLGADYATLKAINPRLIYCSESGYGPDGPYACIPGHDPCYLSIAGALSMIGPRDGAPCPPSNYLGDMAGAALHGLIGILIALIAREKTGKGQFVDVTYTDSVISLMDMETVPFFLTETVPRRGETFVTGAVAWSNVYQCKDGEYFSVACGEIHFWENLCRAIQREDLIPYRNYPPSKQDEGIKELADIFLTKTRDEWWAFLKDKDTCVAPVYYINEAVRDPQVLHRGMVLELDHPTLGSVRQIGFPIKLSDTPARIKSLGTVVGSDTQKILEELGYSREDMRRLQNEKAVG